MRISLFFFILLSQILFAQKNEKKIFKMQIMSPENISIPQDLVKYKDTILSNHIKGFYNQKKHLQDMISFTDYPEDMKDDFEKTKKDAALQLKYMDSIESNLKDYTVSEDFLYSVAVLNMVYNEYEPYSEISGSKYSSEANKNIENYCKKNNLDYFIFFDNPIITKSKNDYVMSSTLKVFSKKKQKIIVEQKITGDTNSYGDLWTCGNPLSCLIITSIRSSLEVVIPEINKKQKK